MSYKCVSDRIYESCTWFSYGCDQAYDCTSSTFVAVLLRVIAPIAIAFYACAFIVAALILIGCGARCFYREEYKEKEV